eukprot:scaffold22167_cov142-Skeletonema_marinoi.AAC.1
MLPTTNCIREHNNAVIDCSFGLPYYLRFLSSQALLNGLQNLNFRHGGRKVVDVNVATFLAVTHRLSYCHNNVTSVMV